MLFGTEEQEVKAHPWIQADGCVLGFMCLLLWFLLMWRTLGYLGSFVARVRINICSRSEKQQKHMPVWEDSPT